jgi:hypothetical protein
MNVRHREYQPLRASGNYWPASGTRQEKPPRYVVADQTMRLGITGLGIQQQRTVRARPTISD